MRILVTGSTGFVGRHLVRRLEGHDVFEARRDSHHHAVERFQPDVVFSLAGVTPGCPYSQWATMLDANVNLVSRLLNFVHEFPYRAFIHVGSSSEYGRCNGPISESEPLKPATWYEATKAAGSMLCQGFARAYDKPIVVARPFSLYGPGDKPAKLIPTLIRAARGDRKVKISDAVHDWLYIDDFIDGLLRLMEGDVEPGEAVNFGTGIQTTNLEVARLVERIMGVRFEVEQVPPLRPYDSLSWCADTTRARIKYGWRALVGLEEGLRRTVNDG